ncbi:AAA family ATPase [Erythrobacter sp. A6_0]|uniref:McrB family protein n=1 Tax=Erythrobacter sp. A6_0 TaxID=2821089 RepID=UPI001ADB22D2|nr:AAA family ATPase [Erythrobacter sp. A6_0]MBO9511683.1 AAA family ATPase [Erythrobacter sp. A6_0]
MMQKIRADRVSLALTNLADWKSRVHAQGSTHLFPLLALLSSGVGTADQPIQFNETPNEFDFWDKYFRLKKAEAGKPYFNPVTLRFAEEGFPHSNSATIRKNTFAGKWKGAIVTRVDDKEEWELAENYAEIFRDKVLSKGGASSRVPVVDVAALLFRGEEFADNATARTLEARFRAEFPQRDQDYERIFVFHDEESERIFADSQTDQDYETAIIGSLVQDVRTAAGIASLPEYPGEMDLDDPILTEVQKLLRFGTSGIIFSGTPGTGKSYYAKRIAKHLVEEPDRDIFRVQFHPSYGYEDFVEGYRPNEEARSGYQVVGKIFLEACTRADAISNMGRLVVVIVDEINRGDPARVFGELLTYIEQDYREEIFQLPFSGKPHHIPKNLILLGTMNPYDRSIAQADAAFVRRFDHIHVEPSREIVELLLEDAKGFDPEQVGLIGDWFDAIQRLLPFGLGHSYFARVASIDDLLLVWRYRLRHAAEIALALSNQGDIENLERSFQALIRRLEGAADEN